ncbi:hypothetical protein N9499_07850 [Octadecabacter sp.]|nr:hypothetical protein [Octadecabacter sp.]
MATFAVVLRDKSAGFDVAQRARIFEGGGVEARKANLGELSVLKSGVLQHGSYQRISLAFST